MRIDTGFRFAVCDLASDTYFSNYCRRYPIIQILWYSDPMLKSLSVHATLDSVFCRSRKTCLMVFMISVYNRLSPRSVQWTSPFIFLLKFYNNLLSHKILKRQSRIPNWVPRSRALPWVPQYLLKVKYSTFCIVLLTGVSYMSYASISGQKTVIPDCLSRQFSRPLKVVSRFLRIMVSATLAQISCIYIGGKWTERMQCVQMGS